MSGHKFSKLKFVRFFRCERGTQLAEMAIVLPLLLILFGATAEFGRFFYTYTTLAKGTRSAARYITTEVADTAAAADVVATNLAVYGNTAGTGDPLVSGLGPEHITITREGGVGTSYDRVKVEVSGYRYQPIFGLGALLGDASASLDVDVSPSTTMRFF